MSEIIKYFVGIAMIIAAAGQLPKATLFMAKQFIRAQQRGLGSLEEFSHDLQGK